MWTRFAQPINTSQMSLPLALVVLPCQVMIILVHLPYNQITCIVRGCHHYNLEVAGVDILLVSISQYLNWTPGMDIQFNSIHLELSRCI